MTKRLVVAGMMLLLVLFTGCGKKADEDELYQANNLIQGLAMLGMMTSVDKYGIDTYCAPPLGWIAPPETIDVPNPVDWPNNVFYKFFIKFPLDSAGTVIDSITWLAMPSPDVWGGDTGTIRQIDVGLLADHRNIWFHTIISLDSVRVRGNLKWNWEDTWYKYEFDVSIVPGDSSAEINISTSPNIQLYAHFKFDQRGAGTTEENWGKFGETIFVRYEFFAEPDANGYDGYYILLSEGWKVKHFFKLEKPAA
ncbi:MAG: hypothetical protein N3A65_08280 [candidate division WOR-3 bacterium]|nr:hypothetical protein [candidate division WOR-3 bacterium]